MQDASTDVGIMNISGSPEGVVPANPASIAMDRTNGNLWKKKSGTGNTGWEQIATGSDVPESFQTDSGTATPSGGVLIITGGANSSTSGSGNTVTITATGSGDVVGPASSTDNALVRWDGTTGKLIQNGVTTEDDTGNISQTAAVSGATLSYTLANTSNTASAQANQVISVAGATASDAFTTYTVTGTQSFSIGIDNSVSDEFTISASTALGTSNILRASSSSVAIVNSTFQVLGGDVSFSRENIGGSVAFINQNTDNTNAASHAYDSVVTGGSSSGDPYNSWTVSGVTGYSLGIDNSVTSPFADPFQLTNSSTGPSAGSPLMVVQSTGEITYPLQSAFLAYVNTTITNVTGDNTLYTIIYDTEVFDQNSDFDLASSTFTAPVTGKYLVNYNTRLGGGTVISNIVCDIVSSNNSFRREGSLAAASTVSGGTTMSILLDMDAADTFVVKIACSDTGGKIDDITGVAGGLIFNSLSGNLVC